MSGSAVEVVRPAVCRTCGDPLLGFRKSNAGKTLPVIAHVSPLGSEQCTIKAKGPFEFHVHVQDMTPAQVDERLSEIYIARGAASVRLHSELKSLADVTQRVEEGRPLYGRDEAAIARQVADVRAWIVKLDEAAEFYGAEFERRGGWLRYFLVQNSGGHVHRGMNCTSCFDSTRYAWLVDLADCDEAQMVEQYGMTACTVCFPNAPTLPGWARDVEAEAAKAEKTCPRSGDYVGYGQRWATCPECREGVSVTKNGNLRKHDRKSEVSA